MFWAWYLFIFEAKNEPKSLQKIINPRPPTSHTHSTLSSNTAINRTITRYFLPTFLSEKKYCEKAINLKSSTLGLQMLANNHFQSPPFTAWASSLRCHHLSVLCKQALQTNRLNEITAFFLKSLPITLLLNGRGGQPVGHERLSVAKIAKLAKP